MAELTEKDLNCIARIFQGVIYKDGDMFHCCRYCIHGAECSENVKFQRPIHFDYLRKRIQDITGVYLSTNAHDIEKKFQLPTNTAANKQ